MSVTIGVGGPVGSGKTALLDSLCKQLRDRYSLAVVTNDIYTYEDAEFLMRSGALPLERIRGVTQQLTNPPERVIFNLHCPPYASGLDDAPGLNEDMTPKHGGHAPEPVGSKAVRAAIEETKPALALHGHIHEARGHARIGNTLCINPGSAYEQGELLGALIELNGKKVKNFVLTSG